MTQLQLEKALKTSHGMNFINTAASSHSDEPLSRDEKDEWSRTRQICATQRMNLSDVGGNTRGCRAEGSGYLSKYTHICDDCARHFPSQQALSQHLRHSRAHTLDCNNCARRFSSQHALSQHLHHSQAHTLDCNSCARRFSSQQALSQHLLNSRAHKLDNFRYT